MAKREKPVIMKEGRTRMEDANESASFLSEEIARQPGPYIPGYDEQVAANDIESGVRFASGGEIHGLDETEKRKYYDRFGTEPKNLPYELKFIRVTGPDFESSNPQVQTEIMGYEMDGWKPARAEHFEEDEKFGRLGWGLPKAAEVAADGTIRRWDTALYFRPTPKTDDTADEETRESVLSEIPEEYRVEEDEKEGSKALSFPKV